ncbi:MAG: cell wall hydrolase [Pseudomonadota bacterium]|nr:cell wall hydrolase [Pseudomonadota bacterium]
MKLIVRASGIAAAMLALTATYSAPAMAAEPGGAQPGINYLSHASATTDPAETVQEAAAAPAAASEADAEIRDHSASFMASTMIETLNATMPGEQALAELVGAYGSAQTSNAEQECLAGAVYFEARSEPLQGQLAVADVVINRASSGRYPTTICAVVTQRAQFSFIRNGRFPEADRSSEAWRRAVAIARIARERLANQVAPNVLWYHADYVAPVWRRNLTRVSKIGAHIFYS